MAITRPPRSRDTFIRSSAAAQTARLIYTTVRRVPADGSTHSVEENSMRLKVTQRVGFLLLGLWLVLQGLVSLIGLRFAGLGPILGLLAIAAGILIVLER